MASSSRAAFAVLGLGVLVASSSSILVRVAQDAGIASLAIAAWRMTIAAVLVWPFALRWRRPELARLGRRDGTVAALAGAFLAGHFIAWITSLEYTSVASSAALVTTNPIWVGLATVFLLREPLPRLSIVGIAISLAGCALILWADASAAPAAGVRASDPTFGNLLALLGALGVSAYLLTGRTLARRLSLLGYISVVYGVAAVLLLAVAFAAGVPMSGYGSAGWLALAGLAIGPQLIGHTSFNWALRRLSPTFVALSILGEPVGSALLAGVLLGEIPGPLQLTAFMVLLAGIVVAALGERPRPAQ
ncbi:MAG: DMT family transporter [Lautropia sp.]